VRCWLRPQDRLVACELEPGAAAALARDMHGDRRAKAIAIDGWTALTAYVPPKERRGAVLIDPPFEQPGELGRIVEALTAAHRKWATGTFLAWYPIKDRHETDAFARRLERTRIPKILRAELMVAPATGALRLAGTGLIVVNPPWRLEQELATILPALLPVLAQEGPGSLRIDRLTPEK
jgi:23S rRNA (adenine2030-N6)-methyltransferase